MARPKAQKKKKKQKKGKKSAVSAAGVKSLPPRVLSLEQGLNATLSSPTTWPVDIPVGATVQIVSQTSPIEILHYMVVDKGRSWHDGAWHAQDTIAIATPDDLQDDTIAAFRQKLLRIRGWLP